MITKEYEGKTKEEALKIALEDLRKREDEVEVEVIDDGAATKKVGFFGFRQTKTVRILVSYSEQESEVCAKAKSFLLKTLKLLDIEASIHSLEDEDGLIILRVASENSGLIIGRHGSTLESLQFLTNVVANKGRGTDNWLRVIIDAEGWRDKREDHLRRMATRVAEMAIDSRKSYILQPLNPAERRVIHLTLQDRTDVATESEGEGLYKRVRIDPVGEFAPDPDSKPVPYDPGRGGPGQGGGARGGRGPRREGGRDGGGGRGGRGPRREGGRDGGGGGRGGRPGGNFRGRGPRRDGEGAGSGGEGRSGEGRGGPRPGGGGGGRGRRPQGQGQGQGGGGNGGGEGRGRRRESYDHYDTHEAYAQEQREFARDADRENVDFGDESNLQRRPRRNRPDEE